MDGPDNQDLGASQASRRQLHSFVARSLKVSVPPAAPAVALCPLSAKSLRTKRAPSTWVKLLFATALVFVPVEARCQDTDTSERDSVLMELVREGVVEYRDNHPDLALAAFNKAWQIKKTAAIAANLGRVELKLGHYRDAAEHWTYYLDQHPSDTKEADDALAECREHVGSIRVTVNQPGALVSVDGNSAGSAPLDSELWVDPGQHTVYATLDARKSPVTTVNVVPGVVSVVKLDLPQTEAPAGSTAPAERLTSPLSAPPAPDAQRDAGGGGMKLKTVIAIGGTALTATAAGLGVAYLLKANAAANDADTLRRRTTELNPAGAPTNSQCFNPKDPELVSTCTALQGKNDEWARARAAEWTFFVTAGVLGVATVTTYILWPEPKQEHPRIAVAPWVLPGRRGVDLQVTF